MKFIKTNIGLNQERQLAEAINEKLSYPLWMDPDSIMYTTGLGIIDEDGTMTDRLGIMLNLPNHQSYILAYFHDEENVWYVTNFE